MVKNKGNIIRGVKKKPSSNRCNFGRNKNTGKCLKHPRRNK